MNTVPIIIEGYEDDIKAFDRHVHNFKLKHNKAAAKRVIVTRNYTVRYQDIDEWLGLLKPFVRTMTNVNNKTFKWKVFKLIHPIVRWIYKLFNVKLIDFDSIKADPRLYQLQCSTQGGNAHMYILPLVGVTEDKIVKDGNGNKIELI